MAAIDVRDAIGRVVRAIAGVKMDAGRAKTRIMYALGICQAVVATALVGRDVTSYPAKVMS